MSSSWKFVRNFVLPVLMAVAAASLVIHSPKSKPWSGSAASPFRQAKTINMTSGMNMLKDMLQNGMPFRPVPPPFPSLKNLFKVNGTMTWIPLGSLIFGRNGKIIGG